MLTTWIDTGGVTGLTPNTTYAYQVKSTDIYNRNTAWSTAISTTLAAVPPMPLINQVVNSSMSITVLPNPSNPYYTQYAVAFTSSGPTQYLNTSGALGFSLFLLLPQHGTRTPRPALLRLTLLLISVLLLKI